MGLRCLTVRVSDRIARHLISTGYLSLESAETIGKDQTAESDHPAHQLVTRYVQNRDSLDWAIFVGKIIMAQPSPLLALSSPKSRWPRSGRIRFECKRLGQGKSLAAVMSVR